MFNISDVLLVDYRNKYVFVFNKTSNTFQRKFRESLGLKFNGGNNNWLKITI